MKRELIIEIVTYIMVILAMWVISPWIGKLLDKLYYPSPRLFSNSFLLLLVGGVIAISWVWTDDMDNCNFQNHRQRHA